MSSELTLLEIMRCYSTEEAARAYFERRRWPSGPVCPHCGSAKKAYARTANEKTGTRPGLYKCSECGDTFTVTVGTVNRSHAQAVQKPLAPTGASIQAQIR